MSEDQTKILDSEKDAPDEAVASAKAQTTNPMLEAILARVTDGFVGVNKRLDTLEIEVGELRRDIRRIDLSIDKLHLSHYESRSEIVELRLKQRELEVRIDNLERKAS
ncbi:MAG: hypothetical protein HY231_14460 [Acidobacteria bacterium]|nr:hypothetical protein [Acidobacteriota bacterium]